MGVVGGSALGRLGGTAVLAAAIAVAAFPYRLEYLAHLLAGMGLAGMGLAGMGLAGLGSAGLAVVGPGWARGAPVGAGAGGAGPRRPDGVADHDGRGVVAVVVAVAVVALVVELVQGPAVDVLDVANTLLGGVLGAAAVAGSPRAARPWMLAALGLGLVLAGVLLRYPVQATVKHWWWVGS